MSWEYHRPASHSLVCVVECVLTAGFWSGAEAQRLCPASVLCPVALGGLFTACRMN